MHARVRTHDLHGELLAQATRAGLIVSPAASKMGNFNGVSTAVVVSSASLSNLLGCRGAEGTTLLQLFHNVQVIPLKMEAQAPCHLCQRQRVCRLLLLFYQLLLCKIFLLFSRASDINTRRGPVGQFSLELFLCLERLKRSIKVTNSSKLILMFILDVHVQSSKLSTLAIIQKKKPKKLSLSACSIQSEPFVSVLVKRAVTGVSSSWPEAVS